MADPKKDPDANGDHVRYLDDSEIIIIEEKDSLPHERSEEERARLREHLRKKYGYGPKDPGAKGPTDDTKGPEPS